MASSWFQETPQQNSTTSIQKPTQNFQVFPNIVKLNEFNINVKTTNKQTFSLTKLTEDTTIGKVKEQIKNSKGFEQKDYQLMYNKTILEDDKTLLDYNITDNLTINLHTITHNKTLIKLSRKYDYKSIDVFINNGFILTTKKIYKSKFVNNPSKYINYGIIYAKDDNKIYIDFRKSSITFEMEKISFSQFSDDGKVQSIVITNDDFSKLSKKLSISSIFEKQPLMHIPNYYGTENKQQILRLTIDETFKNVLDFNDNPKFLNGNLESYLFGGNTNQKITINYEIDKKGVLKIPEHWKPYQFKTAKGYYNKLKSIDIEGDAQLCVSSTKKIILGKKLNKPITIKGNNICFYSLDDLIPDTKNKFSSLVFNNGIKVDGFTKESSSSFNIGQNENNNICLTVYNKFISKNPNLTLKIEKDGCLKIKKHCKYINKGKLEKRGSLILKGKEYKVI
jgi:hypothetical protein